MDKRKGLPKEGTERGRRAGFFTSDNVYSVYFPIGEVDGILVGHYLGDLHIPGKQTEC
jgi:hypothetical protein